MSVVSPRPDPAVSRTIGNIAADVTIEESHQDHVEITEHPVETGSPISDHAYAQPVEVTVRVGFSNSSAVSGGDPNYATASYQKLVALQKSLNLFTIVTGKRTYQNMMCKSVALVTDETKEYAAFAVAHCKEIIIVSTSTSSVGSASNMSQPQVTGSTQNNGVAQLKPAPSFNPLAPGAGGFL